MVCFISGLKFWKSPRRKVFAVPMNNLRAKSRGKKREREVVTLDSDDDDDAVPKRTRDDYSTFFGQIDSKLDHIKEGIDSIKDNTRDVLYLNERSKLPIGIQRLMRDTFQCKICLCIPIRPPAIMSKCCKSIIGCERCVNEWYSGPEALTKTCPSCRAERGYSETMMLRGLDRFLQEVKSVIVQAEDASESDSDELPRVLP